MMDIKSTRLTWVLLGGLFSFAASVCAQDSQKSVEKFLVKPNKCIALHRGQLCYQKIRFKWQTPNSGEFCILRVANEEVIVCWQGNDRQEFEYKFSGVDSEIFELREKKSNKTLAQVQVRVAWVYQKSKKSSSGWRLF